MADIGDPFFLGLPPILILLSRHGPRAVNRPNTNRCTQTDEHNEQAGKKRSAGTATIQSRKKGISLNFWGDDFLSIDIGQPEQEELYVGHSPELRPESFDLRVE